LQARSSTSHSFYGKRASIGDDVAYLEPVKIRLLKHTAAPAVPDCGSYEVRFPDGCESVYFYWDDNPGRRSITRKLSCEEAERKAKDLARAEQEKLGTS
jgi:hypothetical protein